MRNLVIILLISLLCLDVSAIDEIVHQTVGYGDYIRQYAIVNILKSDGAYYPDYCTDCSAYITVQDDKNILINNKSMSNISIGLFGYKTPTSLRFNKTYNVMIYTISPTYGDGIVYSTLAVTNVKSDSKSLGVLSSSNIINSGSADDFTDAILNGIPGYNALQDFFNLFEEAGNEPGLIGALFGYIMTVLGGIKLVLTIIASFSLTLANWMVNYINWCIAFWNPSTREGAISDVLILVSQIFRVLFAIFLPPLAIFELYIIHISIRKRGFDMIAEFLDAHRRYLTYSLDIFLKMFTIVMESIKLLITIVSKPIEWVIGMIPL